jgi:hypothetical protein
MMGDKCVQDAACCYVIQFIRHTSSSFSCENFELHCSGYLFISITEHAAITDSFHTFRSADAERASKLISNSMKCVKN